MKKLIFFAFLFFHFPALGQNSRTDHLQLHVGYGTENNFGSTGYFGGFGMVREKNRKFILGADLTRFTTEIHNAYDEEDYDGEEQDYKAWFLTTKAGYRLIGHHGSFFSLALSAGPALKYFNYKTFQYGQIRYYYDGRRIPIDSTLRWNEDKGVNISLYAGISFDFRLSQRLKINLFADTYHHETWLEHFMPGIRVLFKMKNEE